MAITEEENPVRFAITMTIALSVLPQLALGILIMLEPGEISMLAMMGASQVGLMLLPTLFSARFQSLPAGELFRLKNPGWIGFAFLLLGLLSIWPVLQFYLLFQELYLLPSWLMEEPEKYQEVLRGLFGATGVISIASAVLIGAIIPGISEELLFRGLLLRSLQERITPARAITITAIIFGAIHLNPIHLVPLVALGAFFGLLTVVTDSIYPAMLGHAIFNSISIVALVLDLQPENVERTNDDLLALLPVAVISLGIFVWVVQWMLRYGRRIEGEEVV